MRIRGGGLTSNTFITLRGTGIQAPSIAAPRALAPTNVSATSYIANWEDTENTDVDYYIVTRTIYAADGSTSTVEEQAHGDDYSFYISGFKGSESYTVRAIKGNLSSDESNSIIVREASISEVDAEVGFGISIEEGGLRVITTETLADLCIYEANGRTAARLTNVANNTRIALNRGLYIIRAHGVKPLKAIIK